MQPLACEEWSEACSPASGSSVFPTWFVKISLLCFGIQEFFMFYLEMLQNLQFINSLVFVAREKRSSCVNASVIFLHCDFVKLQNYEVFQVT